MNYRISVRPLATIEILDAYDWYELLKPGLGMDFLEEIERFYSILYSNPETFSFYHENIRQGKLNRFPYVVIYEAMGEDVVIYSVFMQKQNPNKKSII